MTTRQNSAGTAAVGAPCVWDTGHVNTVPFLYCGLPGGRSAIRAPYELGLVALAYLRWRATAARPAGGVIADRTRYLYFLIPSVPPERFADLRRVLGRVPDTRLCDSGTIVMLPDRGARIRWRFRAGNRVSDTDMVCEALRVAHRAVEAGHRLWIAACLLHAATDHLPEAAR
jgi:hypothetical protein